MIPINVDYQDGNLSFLEVKLESQKGDGEKSLVFQNLKEILFKT